MVLATYIAPVDFVRSYAQTGIRGEREKTHFGIEGDKVVEDHDPKAGHIHILWARGKLRPEGSSSLTLTLLIFSRLEVWMSLASWAAAAAGSALMFVVQVRGRRIEKVEGKVEGEREKPTHC